MARKQLSGDAPMTPQETQLVTDLFDRLAKLEGAPRDAAAEQLISDGLQRAPHAVYALVQTALVQDEALKRANAHIEELQAQIESAQAAEPQQPASFLDAMRQPATAAARGSVPNVRPPMPGAEPQNLQPPEPQPPSLQPQGGQPPPGYPGSAPFGPGGSFLGNAASTAAGMIGGSLLLNGIRSMFGQRAGSPEPSRGLLGDASSLWSKKADAGATGNDAGRGSGAQKASDQPDEAEHDRAGDIKSVADTDDEYDFEDADLEDEDFDIEDSDSESYDD